MQKRKLQVFVSSTYLDLKEERQTAVKAILNAGHIPAGMELFTAGDESQWTIIKRWIEESDVYMLLLGGRYGSIELKSGKSYTHLEYDYAVQLGKPLFAIVTTDKARDEKVTKEGRKVLELDNPQGLKDFKKVAQSNQCSFWDDLKDIKLNINDSIRDIEYRYADSLKGWVKADDTDYSSISEELARLSRENSELKNLLEEIGKEKIIGGRKISEWTEFLQSKKLYRNLVLDEGRRRIICTNFFQLFMINGLVMNNKATKHDIVDGRYLSNLNLVLSDGSLTEWGTQLLMYVESQEIDWREGFLEYEGSSQQSSDKIFYNNGPD